MNTLNIVDDNLSEKEIKINRKNYFINWNRYETKNLKSIIKYIEINSHFFKKKYLELILNIRNQNFFHKTLAEHYNLDRNFSLWEMSLFEEKNIYKNPEINEIIKILALKEIIKKNKIKKIIIISNNPNLKSNISGLIKDVIVELKLVNKKKIKDKFFLKKNFFYYFYYIFMFFLRRFSFKKNIYQLKKKAILIIDYFTYFDENKSYKGIYDSIFWKKLTPLFENKKMNLNYLHITLDEKKNTYKKNYKILNYLNSKKFVSHNILDCQINLKVFYNVLINWFFNYLKYLILKIKYRDSYIFKNSLLDNMFADSFVGVWSIKNLYFFYLFKNFFQNTEIDKKVCIYVNEFQGWEKTLIYNLKRKKNLNHNIYGIQFNPIRDWDLRYFFTAHSKNFHFYPNNIITPYYSSKDRLKKNFSKIKNFKIYISENLRPLSIKFKNKKVLKKNKILVVGDHDDDSTTSLLNFVDKLNYPHSKISFEYKPHPISKIDLSNFKNLNNLKVYRNNDCFKKRYSSYLVSNKTTLGLDLINENLKTAILLDQKTLNYSPVDKNYKFFISNDEEFKNFINFKKKYNRVNQNKKKKVSWKSIIKIWKKYLKK